MSDAVTHRPATRYVTFAALAEALAYPQERQLESLRSMLPIIGEGDAGIVVRLRAFIEDSDCVTLAERKRRYVATFDLARTSGLYLTHYIHGDRRERGMALVRLTQRYRMSGLELEGAELPDHLGVILEFASHDPAGGVALLEEFHAPLIVLADRLRAADSPYAEVAEAVLASLSPATTTQRDTAQRLADGPPPAELVGLEPFAPPEIMPRGTEAPASRP